MRAAHYIFLAVILATGLAGSILLIPRESDLSLMYFRGHHFDEARLLYEKRLKAGDRSADVVIPLAELYVQSGEVDRAVGLLQRLHMPDAGSLELFQRIAIFQKYGQQMQEYLQTLETISRIEKSEDGLRELASQYRYANQTAKLIPALQTLIARYPGEAVEYVELANLLAVGHRPAEAAGVLERFEARHPKEVTADTVEFLVSVLIDCKETEPALGHASRWLDRHRDSNGVVRLAAVLRNKGQAALAERLLAPFVPAIDNDPTLLAEWLQQQIAAGHNAVAFERLDGLRRRHLLPEDLIEPFAGLALAKGDVGLAIDVTERRGLHHLSEALLGELAERALSAGREAFAYRLEAALGDAFVKQHPLLAARLANARGDRPETTRRLQMAEAASSLSSADRLAVAGLDVSLGRQSEASTQLAQIPLEAAPGDVLLEAARLYVAAGKAVDGANRFDGLRRRRPSAAIDLAWSLVSAGAGRGSVVAPWLLATPPGSIAETLLRDLYFLAQDRNQAELALAAARCLYRDYSSQASELMLVRALTAAGRPFEALPHIRVLLTRGHDPDREDAYVAALIGAIGSAPKGSAEPLRRELRGYWTARLGKPGRGEQEQLDVIYGLLELDAWDAALPPLEVLARQRAELVPLYIETALKAGHAKDAVAFLEADLSRTDLTLETREARVNVLMEHGGLAEAIPHLRRLATMLPRWVPAYEEALTRLGRAGELVEFWSTQLAGGNLAVEERRIIGFKLVDAGRTELARQVFRDLARTASADHADVAEFLFLSGSKPGPDVIDWLENRARSASANDRSAWLSLLLDSGSPDRVAAILGAAPPPAGQGGPLLQLYLRALAQFGRVDVLDGVVAREAAATVDRERVRQLANIARDAGAGAAEAAYARLLALDPEDREALHWLGMLSYARAHYSVAEQNLSTLLATSPGSYDDNFYYAELLWRKGHSARARSYYGRAIRLIESTETPSAGARTAHAQAIFRCGYVERSLREYRTLVAGSPRDGELRADFGAMLLEARLYDEAEDVLSSGAESGGTRLALLRAQLLAATARRSDALELARDLAEANPDSGSVLASLGLIEQGVGRNRRTRTLLDRAVGKEPGNEDLRETRAALERDMEGPFRAELESRRIEGSQREDVLHILGERILSRALRFQFAADQNRVSIQALRYVDGHSGSFEGVRRRGEAALDWESESGTQVKSSLFAGSSTLGGGVIVGRPDPKGVSTIRLEMNRAEWGTQESLAQEGVRDHIEVRRETVLTPAVSAQVGAAANRYRLPGAAEAARSAAATGDLRVRVLHRPDVALDYSFDGEYRLAGARGNDGATHFQAVPLASREVHSVMVQAAKPLTRGLRVEGSGGIAIDRLGGSAPFWNAAAIYQGSPHFGAQVDYDRRLYTLDSTRIVTSFRFGFWWRF